MTYSLDRPAEGHKPSVGRVRLGNSATFNRPLYGTSIRCSCGGFAEQINEAPSKGGRSTANHRYRQHLSAEGFFS